MIIEKCFPTLGRRASTPGHILGDARLRDLKPELEQFAVDAWRAPNGFSTLIRRIRGLSLLIVA